MTRRFRDLQRCAFSAFVIVMIAGGAAQSGAQNTICNSGVCVQTWQQDTNVPGVVSGYSYRTGENLSENTLTEENFPNSFGQLCHQVLGADGR